MERWWKETEAWIEVEPDHQPISMRCLSVLFSHSLAGRRSIHLYFFFGNGGRCDRQKVSTLF